MVSTRTKNTPKSTYAERVLGAFSQVQKEHRKNAVHLATLRAQVKKTALAKKDKLGPHWTHWVGKAVNKLESEGILEPAAVAGNVALTPTGKKAISTARRSLNHSNEGPSTDQEGSIWKQVLNRGSKRHLGNDSDDEPRPTQAGSPKKRARLSGTDKRPISRTTKGQLNGTGKSKKQAQVHQLLRGVSPLTDVEDDEESDNTQLREKLKEREEEIENIRRELAAVRQRKGNRTDNNIRFSTPESTIDLDVDQPSSPTPAAPAISSHNRPRDVVRTQSGSYIPNLSKQPTPAPSSPEEEMDFDAGTDNFDLALDIERYKTRHDQFQEPPTVGYQSPGLSAQTSQRTDVISRLGQTENLQLERDALIASLKSEIKELKANLVKSAATFGNDAAVWQEGLSASQSRIADRDATIGVLQQEKGRLGAEVADLQQSWKRAEETVAKTSELLRAAESSVEAFRGEEALTANKLSVLENSNKDFRREQERLKTALDQSENEGAKLRMANEHLRGQVNRLTEELESMIRKETERKSEIDDLNEQISRALDEARLVQEKKFDLENSVSILRAEVKEKGLLSENLRNKLKGKELDIIRHSVELREVQDSVEAAQSTISSLIESKKKHEKERMDMTTQIFDLDAALALAKGDLEGLHARLVSADVEKDKIHLELKRKDAELVQMRACLDVERTGRSTAEAKLSTRLDEIQHLEEELRNFKNSKVVDEATLSNLRNSFIDLRKRHLELFQEAEDKFAVVHSSPTL